MESTLRDKMLVLVVSGTMWGLAQALPAKHDTIERTQLTLPSPVVEIATIAPERAMNNRATVSRIAEETVRLTHDSAVRKLSANQEQILAQARLIGEQVGFPETLQVIAMQETLAGDFALVDPGGNSYGVTQVKPKVAQWIAEQHKSGLDIPVYNTLDEYKTALVDDHSYALKLAAAYLDMIQKNDKGLSWKRLVLSYNQGPTGAKRLSDSDIETHYYYQGVKEKMPAIRDFNARQDRAMAAKQTQSTIGGKHYAVAVAEPADSVINSVAQYRLDKASAKPQKLAMR